MSARGLGLGLVLLVACGPEREDEVVLREVCGQAGPVRVFELDGDREVPSIASVEPVGDKLLWHVMHREADSNSAEGAHWITDRCGESPRELEGVRVAWVDPAIPGVVVAATHSRFPRDLMAMDPAGARAPRVLFESVGIIVGQWQGGFVSVDDVEGEITSLSFHAKPADPWADVISVSETLTSFGGSVLDNLSSALGRIAVRDDEILVIDAENNLMRITSPSTPATIEQASVQAFQVSEDGRWLAWQEFADVDDLYFVGEIKLRDRTTGSETVLWEGSLPFSFLSSIDDGVVYSPSGWVRFPGLDLIPRQSERTILEHLDGSRWVASHSSDIRDDASGLSILDLDTGEERVLYLGETKVAETTDDGMEVVGWIDFSSFPTSVDESNLLWVPYDGSPPTELARAVTAQYQRLDDGRVVTPLGVDTDFRGRLVLVDPDTLEEGVIDRDVYVYDRFTVADPAVWGDDVVLYQVDDGDRSGIWIAGLPESP